MSVLRILHLVGSAVSSFYCDLSSLYAKDCMMALANPAKYQFLIAYVTPDGQWRFPTSLDPLALAEAKPMSLPAALEQIHRLNVDLALPQMFCIPGMTDYRALLNLLEIPFIGNLPAQMAVTADKASAKAIVAAAGVQVPKGELLRQGESPTIAPRSIVKPNNADNSMGIALINQYQDYPDALETAFQHSSEVIVEEFIELGREVRCGVIVQDGELVCLPLREYGLDKERRPIRTYDHKLKKNSHNQLDFTPQEGGHSWIVPENDGSTLAVWEAAKKCHSALGCRHYSLFDFRIDPEGQPWFLEAGLYCSFAPKSVVVSMMEAAGIPLSSFFDQAVQFCLATYI